MAHIYQIPDCDTLEPAGNCEEALLISKQNELGRSEIPEAEAGRNMAKVFDMSSALPLYISAELLRHVQNVGNNLHAAITDLVSRWWDDDFNLRAAIPLDPKIERILRRLESEGVPWQTGVWRPDFLIEDDLETPGSQPSIKICEINARFGFNGFFMGQGLARFYENDTSPTQPAFSNFKNSFRGIFDDTPVHVLKVREHGYDIHYLPRELGGRLVFVNDLSSLRIVTKGTKNHLVHVNDSGRQEEVFQIALELHQDEILSMPEDILWEVSIRARVNDMRTIMLVHDKRMLGIVRQQLANLVARGTISPEGAIVLAKSLAETCLPGTPEYRQAIASDKDVDWLFKPAGSGKGAGIVFKNDISQEDWQALTSKSQTGASHVLQKAVTQKVFDLFAPSSNSCRKVQLSVVGTFFNINGHFRGFGPWRASASKLCALSTGESSVALMGVCNRSCLPFPPNPLANRSSCQSTIIYNRGGQFNGYRTTEELDSAYHSGNSDDGNSLASNDNQKPLLPAEIIVASSSTLGATPSHVAKVHESLEKHGVALVRLDFEDPESDYLVSLVRDGLHPMYNHGLPVDHSKEKGWLWDVKPVHGKLHVRGGVAAQARSETMDVFPWHTDCSFEDCPPRHFALHVLHADRCGGGSLSIVRTKDVVMELSEEAIYRLSLPEFAFRVPNEFHKDSDSLTGALLDMSNDEPKLRYRRDIITPLTERAESALDELDAILDDCRSKNTLKAEDLPDGMVIVLDNARWLHARNQVNDPNRHLRRVRWNAQPFPSNPQARA
ncbi:hypothetical protein DRE_04403 [Drechslerella stenobrocha 248]|uniref:TauD/TfdA-like domain-containing protein n=1 Tax=Drechslerella stenobrocha 248 TaxID=1043628 RepID=W7IBN2_9PEZI|nr:hypothetical protein DRE_04403 [Drechslerella stenobrocha 248]